MMRPFPSTLVLAVAVALSVLALASAPASAQASAEGETHFQTGLMHLREGRTDLALEEFKKAVKADPKNPYFYKGLGQAYARKLKFDDAIEAFQKALELNPYYVDVRNDLGSALVLSGKREEGKKEFVAAWARSTSRRRTTWRR
jgi:protein O-GlcNAc transferase